MTNTITMTGSRCVGYDYRDNGYNCDSGGTSSNPTNGSCSAPRSATQTRQSVLAAPNSADAVG
jgi:hypothetical protein